MRNKTSRFDLKGFRKRGVSPPITPLAPSLTGGAITQSGADLLITPPTASGSPTPIVTLVSAFRDATDITASLVGLTIPSFTTGAYTVNFSASNGVLPVATRALVGSFTAPAAKPYITAENEIIAFHALSTAPNEEGFRGWTSEAGFTVYTETTPDAVRARIETWRATGTGLIKIKCDWDGILTMSANSFRGPNNTSLTVDAGSPSGYVRPAGGVWVTAAAGRSPVFTAATTGIDIIGMPRLFLENIGVSIQYVNIATSNVWIRKAPTQPLLPIVAIKGCDIGGLTHRPSDTLVQYARGINANDAYVVHVEDTKFYGCRQQFTFSGFFQRSWKNHFKRCVGDIHQHMGHTNAIYAGKRTSAWVEGSVISDVIDSAAFPGLHTDFLQYTFAGDQRDRGSYLVRYNVTHQLNILANDAGTQFAFGRKYTTEPTRHDIVVHDNIVAISAYWAVSYWDTGNGDMYIYDNTFSRSGGTYTSVDAYPAITTSGDVGPGTGTGVTHLVGNIYTKTTDPLSAIQVSSGNYFASPQKSVVSGNGLSEAAAKRHEDVFAGTVSRDGADFMTYTITGEAGADRQHALYAIADHLAPIGGYGAYGASDPQTWPTSPVRP